MVTSRLITPPPQPLGTIAALRTLRRNPAEYWPSGLYHGETFASPLMGRTFFETARPDHAKTVLLDKRDHFERSSLVKLMLGDALGDGLIVADGASWKKQRAIAAPIFRQDHLDDFLPVIDRAAVACVGRLGNTSGPQPMLPAMLDTAMDIIVETMFGAARFDRRQTIADIDLLLKAMGAPAMPDLLNLPGWVPRLGLAKGKAAATRLRAVCQHVLDAKRADGDSDGGMTARLLEARDPETGEGLSDEAIVDNIMTFVGAGHETTSAGLCWALYLIAQQPDLQSELTAQARNALCDPVGPQTMAQLDLHWRVFQEAMRLYPPIAAVSRNVAGGIEIDGQDLKCGDHVTLVIMAMHRNPDLWPDPDTFDADRFLPEAVKQRDRYAYMPFGAGPTICIGWKLAMMEATLILARLLEAFEFTPAQSRTPYPVVRVTTRPDDGMILNVSRRTDI